ncbi:MAG TPA: hypothetical protein VLY63_18190 [Anaerolineae bacterium]|nr:hypothetical protein [Anaerolineae bacterium]
MRNRRLNLQLSDRQQLILGILLVILVAISLLYCLGLASVTVRQVWEQAPPPWDAINGSEESIETLATTVVEPTTTSTSPP